MKWDELTRDQKIYTSMSIITGFVHLLGSFMFMEEDFIEPLSLGVGLIFSGIGSLGAIYFISFSDSIPAIRRDLKRFLMVWTLINFVGYFIFHPGGSKLDLSLLIILIEGILMDFLYMDMKFNSQSPE